MADDIKIVVGADTSKFMKDVEAIVNTTRQKTVNINLQGVKAQIPNISELDKVVLEGGMVQARDAAGKFAKGLMPAITGAKVGFTDLNGTIQKTHVELQNIGNMKLKDKFTIPLDLNNKALDAMMEKGKQWSARSQHMSGSGVDEARTQFKKMEELYAQRADALAKGDVIGANKLATDLTKANNQFKVMQEGLKGVSGAARTWADAMKNAIKQTVVYTLTIGGVRAALDQVKQGIQYILDLNNQMTKIRVLQVEGASSPEEINKLALSYNALAKEMGVTTLEVAAGSVEWLRQGKSVEETQTLLRSTLMLSKLGNLDAAQSTEYLTAITNGFKISAEDAITVVDKLVAVDNIAATSAGELATAMRYTSVTAQQAGVTIEQLISYIGTVSSVTRASAESIGQSFKTMFARMQDIRLGKVDEEGIGINNVEKALDDVDIKLRDSQSEFRDMGTVLEEIAGKWAGMSETQQAYIGKTIAGIRQIEYFKVLMANMSMAYTYQDAQLASAGLAYDRYKIYLESAEAAQNKLKASVEGLWQNTITSKGMIQFYNMLSKIIDAIAGNGGLVPAMLALVAVMVLFKATAISSAIAGIISNFEVLASVVVNLISVYGAMEAASISLNAILASTGSVIAIIGLAIAGVIYGYNYFANSSKRLAEAVDDSNKKIKEFQNNIDGLRSSADSVNELWGEYNKLNAIVDRTDKQQKDLNDTIRSLVAIYPDLVRYYDNEGNLHIANTQTRQQVIDKINEQIAAEEELARVEANANSSKVQEQYGNQQDALANAEASMKSWQGKMDAMENSAYSDKSSDDYKRYMKYYQEQFDIANSAYVKASQESETTRRQVVSNMLAMKNNADKQVYMEKFAKKSPLREALEKAYKDVLPKGAMGRAGKLNTPFVGEVTKEQLQSSLKDYKGYIDAIGRMNKGVKGLKLADVFGGSQKDAQKFMSNLLNEAKDTFNGIDQAYQQGDLGAKEYLSSVNNISDTYTSLFEDILANADDLGIPQTTVEELKNALVDLKTEQEALAASSEFAAQAQGQTYASMQTQGEDAFRNLAQAAYDTGVQIPATFGTGVDQVAAYIKANGGNFDDFIKYMAAQTSQHIVDMVNTANAGAKLVSSILGNSGSMATGGFGGFGGSIGGSKSGGGGGGGGNKNKAEIDALNERKKAIKDLVDEFKKWIDAQKEALKLEKEEKEFNEELLQDQKDLAKTKTRIALLSLDDSEAAKAERLKLEEDAAKQELKINKKKDDRIYDLKIEELDRQYELYKENTDKQIELIDNKIAKLQKEGQAVGGVGSAVGGVTAMYQTQKKVVDDVVNKIIEKMGGQQKVTKDTKKEVEKMVAEWIKAGDNAETAYQKALKYFGLIGQKPASVTDIGARKKHSGGFAGDVASNEEFALLMKGEYVVTEQQMYKFMKSTLPKITSMGGGGTTISMPINVAGNLDKSVMPDLEKMVEKTMGTINGKIKRRGHVRQTNLVGI